MIRPTHLLFAAALALAPTAAPAQSWPAKPVKILVPYAAGGAVDVLARTIGQALSKTWGQQPVVDNRPGAGGIIASQALVQSPPDGYTLILVASGHPLNQFFYPKLPYDTFGDFTAITQVAYSPLTINVAKNNPAKNLQDILAQARAKPESLSYGMSGIGTSAHLAGELLNHMAKVKIVAIPFKGGAPALTAVIAGEIPMSFNPMSEAVGQIAGGTVRAIAVTTKERSPALPDVPTVAEAGGDALRDYEASSWFGLFAPAGTPPEIVNRVQQEVARALQTPALKERLQSQGANPSGNTPAEFAKLIDAETKKWAQVVKVSGAKVD